MTAAKHRCELFQNITRSEKQFQVQKNISREETACQY